MNRNSGFSVEVHHGPTTTIAEVRVDDFVFTGEAKLHPKDERAGLNDSWVGEAYALSRAFQLAAVVLGDEARDLVEDGEPTKQWFLNLVGPEALAEELGIDSTTFVEEALDKVGLVSNGHR